MTEVRMMSAPPYLGTSLDDLLAEICTALQLTPTQFDDAVKKYTAVGEWLSARGLLAEMEPEIYPQGSMLLRTTVKPRSQDEFDLDLVCVLSGCGHYGPMSVYHAVRRRMMDNRTYAGILETRKRCLRLNYAGQFHLDIIPACSDPMLGGTNLVVPDCQLEGWTPSNPKGFAQWFEAKCAIGRRVLAAKGVEPLPPENNPNGKATLKRVVQLLKRHRDVVFNGDAAAPSSVLLTTLAAEEFRGQAECADALQDILDGLAARIARSPGAIMQVSNPSHPGEYFSASWSWESYQTFCKFIRSFRDKFSSLRTQLGLDELSDVLAELFGEEPTKRSVMKLAERLNYARDSRSLRFAGSEAGLTTAVSIGKLVPRTTFFGH